MYIWKKLIIKKVPGPFSISGCRPINDNDNDNDNDNEIKFIAKVEQQLHWT